MLILSGPGIAAESVYLPKLELGISMLTLNIPNYRGSANSSNYYLPAPYIKYRGKKLKVDDGIQTILFDSDRLFVSISANATLPVDEDNPERIGMSKLAANLEIGPSLDYKFGHGKVGEWWVELPVRFAITLDKHFDNIGQVIQPRLAWRKPYTKKGEWKLRFATGPLYATQRFHEYYYSIAASEATANRPAFTAKSGFGGIRTDFSFSRRIGDYWIGGFIRYDSLKDTVFVDSPLVSETTAWTTGFGLAWVFDEQYH